MPLKGKPHTQVRLNPLSCGFLVRFEGELRSKRGSPGGWLPKIHKVNHKNSAACCHVNCPSALELTKTTRLHHPKAK